MRHGDRLLLCALLVWSAGCSTLWPTVVRTRPTEPLFRSSFPLVGGLRMDAAVCSLATIGPEATRVVSPPEPLSGAVSPEEACREGAIVSAAARGRPGMLVKTPTSLGEVYGYLYPAPSASGLLVAFSGLGMPPDGWINERFAQVGAKQGLVTFAPVRDESPRPIYFDPLREARRALEAAARVGEACRLGARTELRFVGISLGGLEALLANRESLASGRATRAAVLDPLMDVEHAVSNLDSYWHSLSVDMMQSYFRRILSGRFGEWPPPRFGEVLARVRSHPEALTNIEKDVPSAWLCGTDRAAYRILVSDTDPVLGDDQRGFARSCDFPLEPARAPGHTPLACRLELFDELVEALRPPDSGTSELGPSPGAEAQELSQLGWVERG